MAQLVLGVAGAVIGGMFGMPSVGWAIGSAVGSAFAPTQKSHGPKLSDLKVTASEYGGALHILEGHPRVAGVVAWSSDKHEIATTTEQGKGGGAESTSYTYECDCFILLADNMILGIRRIWSNGKLVWSIADDSDEETIEASEETTRWKAMRVYTGAADQLPDPVYEAAVGVGNAPAYRGRGGVFFEGLSLGSGGVMPNLTFEVNARVTETIGVTRLILSEFAPSDIRYTPPCTSATSDVHLTTISTDTLLTWGRNAGPDDVPATANSDQPGSGNGDISLMCFGVLGGPTTWAGFALAGSGLSLSVLLPEAHQREWMGSHEIRFSAFLGKIAVGSTREIGTPGEWESYQGRVWLYTLAGAYLGHANTGASVDSLALSTSTLWVLSDGGSAGIRSYAVGSGVLAEGDLVPFPPGTSVRIFVGEDGRLCAANAEQAVYTHKDGEWILNGVFNYVDEEGAPVDLGTNNAIHFKRSDGTPYAAISTETVQKVPPDFVDYWWESSNIPEFFWNLLPDSIDRYIPWALTINPPYTTKTRNLRSMLDSYEVYDPPWDTAPAGNWIDEDSRMQTLGEYIVSWNVEVYAPPTIEGGGGGADGGWFDNKFQFTVYHLREQVPDTRLLIAHSVFRISSGALGELVDANLQDVTERICFRTGLTADDVDATELSDDWVYAFAIPPGPAKAAIDQLATAYYFECVESDKLYFRKRGRDMSRTIPYADVGADALLTVQDSNDLEIPAQVFVKYMNLDDSYQSGSEVSDRLSTDSVAVSNIELALGFTPAQAKGIADTACLDQQIGSRTLSFTLDRRYSELEPTDVVGVQDGFGSTFRARIARISDAGGVRSIEAVADDASVLSATGITSNNYTPDYTVRPVALTDLVVLDMPILRDVDDGPGLYAAGDGLAGTWPGYVLFIEGLQVGTSNSGAAMGATLDVLGNWAGGLVDEMHSVTVQLNPGDQLASITHDQLTSSIRNYAAIGVHGRWELLQYRSAELIGPGQYRLRGLLRGQLGTEHLAGTHQLGDRFVALDGAGMLRPPASIADVMTPRDYQGVTIGSLVSTAPVQSITNTGVGMLPYAPVNLRQHKLGTDIVMTWDRRTRYQTNLLTDVVPLGEATEQYQVDVYDDATVVRTLTTSSPTATYTAAQQTADFGALQMAVDVHVYQISATVGRGTPLIYEA